MPTASTGADVWRPELDRAMVPAGAGGSLDALAEHAVRSILRTSEAGAFQAKAP